MRHYCPAPPLAGLSDGDNRSTGGTARRDQPRIGDPTSQLNPNRDGSDPDDSRDFVAQGAGNIVGGFCQSMPGGGSLSGTALIAAAGAQTRWAIIFSAPVVIICVLAFSNILSLIPMAALAVHLVYSAAGAIKFQRINAVANATGGSYASMVVTFLATLVVPLQDAVLLGIALASVLFIYRATTDVQVSELRRIDGRIFESEPSEVVPSEQVTLRDVHGSLFYAGARTLAQNLPDAKRAKRAVVVLHMRGETNVGSTFLIAIGHYASQLRAASGKLFLAGIDLAVNWRMARTGHLAQIGRRMSSSRTTSSPRRPTRLLRRKPHGARKFFARVATIVLLGQFRKDRQKHLPVKL